ncbi:urea carboxylase [Marinospirillum alkaliphilum]|uniref:Biotin carboxylase n=1 Tax=Marinospirillum alkaliphilum DSM 21637 TaxID=1122209 RepID=A0A1K1WLK7_9GAMM|nr:urea carboxylase [Marinospirillum alkaliphilum]SFX38249.1 urea carboxylase [Marinospirillum alkaliphilum DSM 21637]
MFSKVLIANRGAIAVRLLRTLKKLGITSVVVYHASDARSLHVQLADEAWPLGDGSAAETYLNMDLLLDIARQSGAEAIHPGYGFLSEKPEFVRRCEAAGLVFIGPTAEQMEMFGLKHRARELAQAAGVPLLPGSELLQDLEAACQVAAAIGYPVMLKSTAGGGGIGMQVCADETALREGFERVKRLGSNNFADDGVFLEKFVARARHIEVQVFGDGQGQALSLGERDCSSQRRNQKVVEECPAPGLNEAQRQQLHATAERLLASVHYRNAGTVEFIYDADRDDFYFLEVNTRLQVEHGVTEEVFDIDLVAWMLQLAAAEPLDLQQQRQALQPQGHAVQVRIYAEDPWRNFQPSPGLLSQVLLPELPGVRIDHWIETGIEVPALFDPMLAKVIVHGSDRATALQQLQSALQQIQLYGTQTNLDYLQALCVDPVLQAGQVTTAYLNHFRYQSARIDVLQPGTQTTLQDWPGRQGHWDVGVPPSGPFDSYSFRLGNRLLGNEAGATALEITLQGPLLEFSCATQVLLAGAPAEVLLNGVAVSHWQLLAIQPGDRLQIGRIQQGARAYLCVRGGIQCPAYLGSTSTFTLGQFGGHNGRALRSGDVLQLAVDTSPVQSPPLDAALLPDISNHWQLRVIYGPHGAPDYFTGPDIERFFAADWEVHYNSSRTGIRLIGPKPDWARRDGGEAGMHPSNIHDNAYAFGTVDFTGDMPVILGPDGPSLGGFVCPATVITADLWKLGQLRAGDRIRFVPVSLADAVALEAAQQQSLQNLQSVPCDWQPVRPSSPILEHLPASEFGDDILIRAAGDHFLLVEYGEQQLDLRLRFRAHALMQWLQQHPLPGLKELTPGVRSLQLHFDSQQLSHQHLLQHLRRAEQQLARQLNQLTVPSRTVWLPLSWDDEACQLAIRKYMQSVRKDAPWCPSNLEFIRRINGLDSLDEVKRIVFEAAYLVMGLGDVYLGAPLATPLDPRHRLVTTKYNPARTWTAENSVGIGGSYLCVYGMEGPGGYQFVGRTLQMWNRERTTREFTRPWLLRFFDQIRFYEVSAEELQQIRRDFPLGDYPLKIEEGHFSLAEYQAFLDREQADIQAFVQQREAAFEAELAHWHASGQFNFTHEEVEQTEQQLDWPEGSLLADSPVSGSVWQLQVAVGDLVQAGQTLLVLESMKMEIPVLASAPGVVEQLLVNAGGRVTAGQPLVVMSAAET